jgi:hypothetical protein
MSSFGVNDRYIQKFVLLVRSNEQEHRRLSNVVEWLNRGEDRGDESSVLHVLMDDKQGIPDGRLLLIELLEPKSPLLVV